MINFLPKRSIGAIVLSIVLLSAGTASPVQSDLPAASPKGADLSIKMLATLLRVEGEIAEQKIQQQHQELTEFLKHLRSKQAKYRSDRKFLSYFFYKVHRKFLKQYQSHATLYELLERGGYDCVTGSALYALLLDGLGMNYQVHEFPYHVYLTVITAEHDTLMIESTDPQYGFVTQAAEQKKRFAHYSQPPSNADSGYSYDFSIQEDIGLTELAGLSYFNEAVYYYNKQEFQQALRWLQLAEHLYESQRIEAFKRLIASLAHN